MTRTNSSLVTLLMRPPSWRGSTKVRRPTRVSAPARWAPMSRNRWLMTPSGRLYASILLATARAPSFGTSDQCPPTTRFTNPSWARRLRPLSLPSPGAAANTSVRSRGCPVSRKRFSSATMSSSGVPVPTKPEKAMVSPSRTMAIASAAETILFFTRPRGSLRRPDAADVRRGLGVEQEVLDDRDLRVAHEGWRVTAIADLDRAHQPLLRRNAALHHLAHRGGMQQVGILAAQDERGARDLLPHVPQRDVDHQRPREGAADGRIVMLAIVAALGLHGTVLGHVAPLGVGELAEGLVDRAQVRLEGGDILEVALDAKVGADALQGAAGNPGTEIVEDQAADGRALECRHLHADVPAERGADPVDLGRAGTRDHGGDRGEIERRRIVARVLDPPALSTGG